MQTGQNQLKRRTRNDGADIGTADQILAILSGYRSFTRSEVKTLISELKTVCREETEILFGTSHLAIGPGGLCLTLIV